MKKLKDILSEAYAWERKADGSLPTLKDAIATHAANISETEYKYAGRKVTIDKNGTEDQTKWKVKFTDSGKTVDYVDVVANITPRPKMNEPRWQDNDGDGKWYEPGDDVKEGLTEYGDDETHSLHVPKTGVESYDAAYDKPEDAMNESFWNRVKGNLHGHEYILREAFRK